MTDIPKLPVTSLQKAMQETIHAATAVREGIATHAEKHAIARSEKHAALEADRKLQQNK